MQIKRFEAVDMQEAIKQIKNELGSDAVILSTRKIKKGNGSFGMFSRPLIEVTAAIDPPSGGATASVKEKPSAFNSLLKSEKVSMDLILPLQEGIGDIKKELESLINTFSSGRKNEILNIKDDLSEIRSLMKKIIRQNSNNSISGYHENLVEIYKRMIVNGVDEGITLKVLETVNSKLSMEDKDRRDFVETYFLDLLLNPVKISGPILPSINKGGDEGKKVVILVGPTGVGKTTTIAKLAAEYTLNKKLKVALITFDTYRIAAIEQLKIYAKILKIPVDIVVSENEIKSIIKSRSNADLILIDTAGRSPKDADQMASLQSFVNEYRSIETHLVLSATTRENDLRDILRRFSIIPIDKLLFTKLDETDTYGHIFNIVYQTAKPVSYFTTGQRVPEDIEVVTSKRLSELIGGRA